MSWYQRTKTTAEQRVPSASSAAKVPRLGTSLGAVAMAGTTRIAAVMTKTHAVTPMASAPANVRR